MIATIGRSVGLVVRALAFHQCVQGSISALGVICGLSWSATEGDTGVFS